MIKISLGWKNKDGHSEDQIKSFRTEEDAYQFCVKHIENIMRIGNMRIQRNPASYSDNMPETITVTEEAIREEIMRENAN